MPGPQPLFQPKFTASERAQVRGLLRRSNVPYAQARRAKLANLLAVEPSISSPEAARQLGVHEQFVRKWRRRWSRQGFSLQELPRPGRPPVFSPEAGGHRQERRVRAARPA